VAGDSHGVGLVHAAVAEVRDGAVACAKTRLAQRVRPLRRLPALSLLPGQRPAQEAGWPAAGNRLMSSPSSATIVSAVRRATPGWCRAARGRQRRYLATLGSAAAAWEAPTFTVCRAATGGGALAEVRRPGNSKMDRESRAGRLQ
jgi:hypothetical protein